MAWWVIVAKIVGSILISAALSYFLAPSPTSSQGPPPDPAGIDDFQVPTASVGRDIPVLFGTRKISGPNVVWYGHLRTRPIWQHHTGVVWLG